LDEYASHLPILKSLSRLLPMTRVLEFGAGFHSTPFFLGLPNLERLVSVETDREWHTRIAGAHDDERLQLRKKRPPDIGRFDLIFIDDGTEAVHREATIRWVLSRPHPPVVIHDAEVPQYLSAIDQLAENHVTFHKYTPWTALAWR